MTRWEKFHVSNRSSVVILRPERIIRREIFRLQFFHTPHLTKSFLKSPARHAFGWTGGAHVSHCPSVSASASTFPCGLLGRVQASDRRYMRCPVDQTGSHHHVAQTECTKASASANA